MKKLIFVSLAFFVLSICSSAVFAQKPVHINFAPGTDEKIVTGTLSGYKSKRVFVIRVRAGQTLTTENAGDNSMTIGIDAPKGSTYEQNMAADCHDRNEVTPTVAGIYRITVTECMKADSWRGTFKFKVVAR